MIPNMGGIDPRRMKSMMKQMGISNEEIDAIRVIIETENEKLIIDKPNVTKVSMQGQDTYQVLGEVRKEEKNVEIPTADIEMVSSNANISKEKAKKLLEETKGDIAQAISLAQEKE
jgi:nascent polypeptide-associated complex subunit alpha